MKTSKEQFIKKWIFGYSSPGEGSDYEDELNDVIAEAIAEHEANAWNPYPDNKPVHSEMVLVQTSGGIIDGDVFYKNEWSRHPSIVIAWRNLPEPYQPEKGVNQ